MPGEDPRPPAALAFVSSVSETKADVLKRLDLFTASKRAELAPLAQAGH